MRVEELLLILRVNLAVLLLELLILGSVGLAGILLAQGFTAPMAERMRWKGEKRL